MNKDTYIEHYFEGNLTAQELAEFKKMLENDPEFANSFSYQKNVKQAITLHQREALKKQLQSFESPKKRFKWMYVAASLIALLGLFTYNLFFNTNYDALYNHYYQTYPNTVAPTVRGQNNLGIKSDAFYAYDTGDYQKSEVLFATIYATHREDYALFYQGLSLIELKKYDKALLVFNQQDFTKNNAFVPYIKWYSALAYLKLENKKEAIKTLKNLSKTENPLQESAQKLLSDLD